MSEKPKNLDNAWELLYEDLLPIEEEMKALTKEIEQLKRQLKIEDIKIKETELINKSLLYLRLKQGKSDNGHNRLSAKWKVKTSLQLGQVYDSDSDKKIRNKTVTNFLETILEQEDFFTVKLENRVMKLFDISDGDPIFELTVKIDDDNANGQREVVKYTEGRYTYYFRLVG